jgi:hypothetical protein
MQTKTPAELDAAALAANNALDAARTRLVKIEDVLAMLGALNDAASAEGLTTLERTMLRSADAAGLWINFLSAKRAQELEIERLDNLVSEAEAAVNAPDEAT